MTAIETLNAAAKIKVEMEKVVMGRFLTMRSSAEAIKEAGTEDRPLLAFNILVSRLVRAEMMTRYGVRI